MAYETKVTLALLVDCAARTKSAGEVYFAIMCAANVVGLVLTPYEERVAQVRQQREPA